MCSFSWFTNPERHKHRRRYGAATTVASMGWKWSRPGSGLQEQSRCSPRNGLIPTGQAAGVSGMGIEGYLLDNGQLASLGVSV
jgi:hypothetical protein